MDKTDLMTGLHNIDNALAEIDNKLQAGETGILLLLDVECFKEINNTHGHFLGDKVLMECARILQLMFSRDDVIARIGSDRFLVFTSETLTDTDVSLRLQHLQEHIRQAGRTLGIASYLSITTGTAFCEAGDTAQLLLNRAEEARQSCGDKETPLSSDDLAIATDIKMIWKELRENIFEEGAYCQDYEAFKSIYRFVERGLARTGGTAHAILFSLTDENYNFLPLDIRTTYMQKLNDIIRLSLRNGDTYTHYSSSQFIAMVLGTDDNDAEMIANRIVNTFNHNSEDGRQIRMDYIVNPLTPNQGTADEFTI